jgi:hypothetical protein
LRYSRVWSARYSGGRDVDAALSALAGALRGAKSGAVVSVRRGRFFATTYHLKITADARWSQVEMSAHRRWPLASVEALERAHSSLTAEATAAGDALFDGWVADDRPAPPPFPGLAAPAGAPPLGKLTAGTRGRVEREVVEAPPHEFGPTLLDLLPWRRKGLESFELVGGGIAPEHAVEYEQARRRAFWDQMAFLGPLVLLIFMGAAWAIPLNWWSVSFSWVGVAALAAVYAWAIATKRIGRVAALATAATVAIAAFGLIYATLLAHHGLAPDRAWGARLGRPFFLSVGVGATAGTFDQPLRESFRVVAHLQLLFFVGGTVGTAAWAAWRAISGISKVDGDLAGAHNTLKEIGTEIDLVSSKVQDVRSGLHETTANTQGSFESAARDVFGAVSKLEKRVESIEELLKGLASHLKYEPPTQPR